MNDDFRPRWRPDLHLHTLASDGFLSATQLVERAHAAQINLMAVTDHDSLAGLPEAEQAARRLGIRLIRGVEIGCAGEDEVHILCYFVHEGMQGLQELIAAMRADRAQRQDKYLERLRFLGMPLEARDIPTAPGAAFSRPNLARAMVNKGYASDIMDAFQRVIGVGQPGYVKRHHVSVEDALATMRQDGALPVLAHPGLLKEGLADRLPRWVASGLMGIEAWHPSHSAAECVHWDYVARGHGLLVAGGSDFHAPGDLSHGEVGSMLPHWHSANEDAEALLASAGTL